MQMYKNAVKCVMWKLKMIEGVIWCNFKFCFLFGVLQADRA